MLVARNNVEEFHKIMEFTEEKQNADLDRKIPFKKLKVFDDNNMVIK